MNQDTYIKQFREALILGNKYNSVEHQYPIYELDKLIQSVPRDGSYRSLNVDICRYVEKVFAKRKPTSAILKCLEFSADALQVIEDLQDQGSLPGVPMFLTIGNVSYKGQPNNFTTSTEKLIDLIKQGPSSGSLKLHAWLTSFDFTVLDFTINASLIHEGHDELSDDILVWEHNTDDYVFEPLIVDMLFDRKVCFGGLRESWV